jgi:hypothetical protein
MVPTDLLSFEFDWGGISSDDEIVAAGCPMCGHVSFSEEWAEVNPDTCGDPETALYATED